VRVLGVILRRVSGRFSSAFVTGRFLTNTYSMHPI